MARCGRRGLIIAVVAVGVVAAVALVVLDSGTSSDPRLEPRSGPAVAWTGDELFVYGGERTPDAGRAVSFLDDGALFSGDAKQIELLPSSPLGPLFEPAAVGVGNGVVVLGPSCRDVTPYDDSGTVGCAPGTFMAALYEPGIRQWRRLALPDELLNTGGSWTPGWGSFTEALGTTSVGSAIFAVNDATRGLDAERSYWQFEPENQQWRALLVPSGFDPDVACLAGDRLVALATNYEHGGVVDADHPARHFQPGESLVDGPDDGYVEPMIGWLDLSDSTAIWQLSARGPGRFGTEPPELSCLGDDVLVSGAVSRQVQYRYNFASAEWSTPATAPWIPWGERVWSGREQLVLPEARGDQGVAYDPSTDTWRVVPDLPRAGSSVLWTGRGLVGYRDGTVINYRMSN